MVEFVGRMYKAGVPILAGTDEMPGFALQTRARTLCAGRPHAVAGAAGGDAQRRDRGACDDRGVIAAGKTADLVLIDGDPTTNISDLRKVALVIKGPAAYYPSEVDQALGITPFAAPVRILPAK